MVPPYIPPKPKEKELTEDEKERLRKETEAVAAAAAATAAAAAANVKHSYLESTVASMASRTDKKLVRKDDKVEEVAEEKYSTCFDPEEPYTGDQSLFRDF